MGYEFNDILTQNDYTTFTGVTAGKFVRIAEYVVPPYQAVAYGSGGIVQSVDTRGILYIKLETGGTAPAPINGVIKLSVADPNELQDIPILKTRTEVLSVTKTDRTQGYLLGKTDVWAREKSKLCISINGDADATIGTFDIQAPVTRRTF